MTVGASEPRERLPIGHIAGFLLGVVGLAFCITLLWLGMRAVMDLGGFCASGGPYQIAVECPDAVLATTPLSILGGFVSVGLILWGSAPLGGSWAGIALLAWPALFLALGWNFLEYGFFPRDGGWIWSWLFCGVLFVLMGAVPLVVAWRARDELGVRAGPEGRSASLGVPSTGGRSVTISYGRPSTTASTTTPSPSGTSVAMPDLGDDPDLVVRLERLAHLRRSGDLTNAEYEAVKASLIAEATGDVGASS